MENNYNPWLKLCCLILYLSVISPFSIGTDRITVNQSISGNQTIVSKPEGMFELGFFNPSRRSSRYYIGIWYKKYSVQTVVWVANREIPIYDKHSYELKILYGNLVLTNGSNSSTIWSTKLSAASNSVEAVLHDSGNLVLTVSRNSSKEMLWQSFDEPTDTWLPGGKLIFNKTRNQPQRLISWKNKEDPSPGLFSLELEPKGKQYVIMWNRTRQYWTSGAWNDQEQIFSQVPEMRLSYNYNFSYIDNENESYFIYSVYHSTVVSRFVMDTSGQVKQLTWLENSQEWNLFWSNPKQQCEVYAFCGAYGSCNQNSLPYCDCLKGYVPNSGDDWGLNDYSKGCLRKAPLRCESSSSQNKGDRFYVYSNIIMPQSLSTSNDATIEDCKASCLGQLYVSDGHNEESPSQASSNMTMSLPVTAAIARGVDSIINVLGPDLQDAAKARDMILTLVRLFSQEAEVAVLLESLRCFEHLSLYAPGHMQFEQYVHRLQSDADSPSKEIASTALHGLFGLMRRDAPEIIRTARPGLENRLWDCLNEEPGQKSIQNIFSNWLQQTGTSDPGDWIERCNTILTKTVVKAEQELKTAVPASTAGPDLQDEEVAGFAITAGAQKEDDSQASSSAQELMRWQVRLFAMECLRNLIAMIRKQAAISDDSPGEAALQSKVADVIRIAFSASTAGVTSLRVVGMQIIDQILKMFGRTPDPDFAEAMLLEQYQAQISSALTPAFAADSSPELAAAAVNVCATFIATGIVRDAERMGRILKTLVSALDSFSRDTDTAAIGDLKGLTANAQVMVRMAVFSAWAELQIASGDQEYLVEIVRPHIAQLVPLWISSLREYARLRFEPDISATTATPATSGDLDMVYAALNRETLLKFYQASWLSLVDAIASLIDEDSEFVFDALDNKDTEQDSTAKDPGAVNGIARRAAGINYREEPVAFFFVLYGLAFESLAVRSGDDDVLIRQKNLDILAALKKILRPSVSGNAVYQEVVFAETMDLLDRMVLTESLGMQGIIVDIARNLCIVHPSSRKGQQDPTSEDTLSDDIEQLFELTRIIILVIAGLVPGLTETPVAGHLENSEEATNLVRDALQALVDVSEVFPSIIKTDLHASILNIFVTILGTASCQAVVVPQALPIFRRFVSSLAEDERPETKQQIQNTLKRMLAILRNAQKRETEASLPCEKNTLLAVTVLLSTAQSYFGADDPLVLRFVNELRECLAAPMTTRTAAGCYRTLVSQGVAPRLTFSHLVGFVLDASDLEGIAESRHVAAQTLTMAVGKLAPDQKPAAVMLLIDVLLSCAGKDGPSSHQVFASRLLELAATDNATFRSIIGSMSGGKKQLMEQILKSQAGNRGARQDGAEDREPTIALKMNFGA